MEPSSHGWALWLCVLATAVIAINGSAIEFTTSSSSITPLQTTNFTLRCSLHDTSTSGSGGIVGRKRRSTDDVTTSKMAAHQRPEQRSSSVTNTSFNVDFVTSIVVSRDGADVATLSEHFPATAVSPAPGVHVTGSLTGNLGEKGFLEITWPHPSKDQSGNYRCDVDTINKQGHSFDFSKTLMISEQEVSFNDLVKTVDVLVNKVQDLERHKMFMATLNNAQSQQIISLQQELATKIFFSAAVTNAGSGLTVSPGQVLVFDLVLSSLGGGYNSTTGVFTCPLAGYYSFTVNILTQTGQSVNIQTYSDQNVFFFLKHNDNNALFIYSWVSKGRDEATNSGILKLQVGDTVSVVSQHASQVWSPSSYRTTTFNGNLIATI